MSVTFFKALQPSPADWLLRWTSFLDDLAQSAPARRAPPGELLRAAVQAGLDLLPLPGQGHTLARWQALAAVAAHDLPTVKLFEGHTDALAILAELGANTSGDAGSTAPGSTWAVWCAEPPDARVQCVPDPAHPGQVRLHGTKAWCSGAHEVSHALLSCWDDEGRQCLAAVDLCQPGVTVTNEGWHAVGMAATASVNVRLDDAVAQRVGRPGDYTSRPGFWWGGAGIAACWWGGANAIARQVHAAVARSTRDGPADPHQQAHLGTIDVALSGTAALLRETAAAVDSARDGRTDFEAAVLRVRLSAEATATQVVAHAGRALGAGPLCRDPAFAHRMADLPVFVRQSHAERDLAALGRRLAGSTPAAHRAGGDVWTL